MSKYTNLLNENREALEISFRSYEALLSKKGLKEYPTLHKYNNIVDPSIRPILLFQEILEFMGILYYVYTKNNHKLPEYSNTNILEKFHYILPIDKVTPEEALEVVFTLLGGSGVDITIFLRTTARLFLEVPFYSLENHTQLGGILTEDLHMVGK